MMVMGSDNDIIFIFLATYNLFKASADVVKANKLQGSYHMNYFFYTM